MMSAACCAPALFAGLDAVSRASHNCRVALGEQVTILPLESMPRTWLGSNRRQAASLAITSRPSSVARIAGCRKWSSALDSWPTRVLMSFSLICRRPARRRCGLGTEDLNLRGILRVGATRAMDTDAEAKTSATIQRDPGRGAPVALGDAAEELIVVVRLNETVLRHVVVQQVHFVGRQTHQHLGADILLGILLLIELGVELLVAGGANDLGLAAAAHLERARNRPRRVRDVARDVIPEDAFVYCRVDLVDDVLELGHGPGAQADLLDLHAEYVP